MQPINGITTNYNHNGWRGHISYPLHYQGWKIHVSATSKDYQIVLNHVDFLAQKLNFSFKYAATTPLITSLLDIHGDRINGGKLITIYPKNKEHCGRLLTDLYHFLKNFAVALCWFSSKVAFVSSTCFSLGRVY